MKGFSIGVTTVYVTEAMALAFKFWVAVEPRYTPRFVPIDQENNRDVRPAIRRCFILAST